MADVVVDNSGTLEELAPQLDDLWRWLLAHARDGQR